VPVYFMRRPNPVMEIELRYGILTGEEYGDSLRVH